MARVKLELPDRFVFRTELEVRVGDINYGNHLGNDALLGLLHEARIRLLAAYGQTELDCCGASLIMADCAIVYRSEAFLGETLAVDIALGDFNRHGCDVVYRVTEKASGREVARAKTGIVFFDYAARRIRPVPEAFPVLFAAPA